MSFENLQTHDQTMARAVVQDLLAAGLYVSVNDGEDTVVKHSRDEAAILDALGSTDEDWLIAYTYPQPQHFRGRVLFVWGNEAGATMADCSVSLGEILAKSDALASDMYDGIRNALGHYVGQHRDKTPA